MRRFPKRIMIVPPDEDSRRKILEKNLSDTRHSLTKTDLKKLAVATKNYSGSDLFQLAKEAALAPLRELTTAQINKLVLRTSIVKNTGCGYKVQKGSRYKVQIGSLYKVFEQNRENFSKRGLP